MKLLLSVLLSLCLIGCVSTRRIPAPVPVRAVVTGEIVSYATVDRELRPFLAGDYDSQIILMDARFGCISEEATRKIIAEAFSTFSFDYVEESNDCDDGALQLIVLLRSIFRRDTANVPLAAPIGLIGVKLVSDIPEMGYFLHGGVGYHAIVLARCRGGKYLVIDPATKKISEFTQHVYENSLELMLVIF